MLYIRPALVCLLFVSSFQPLCAQGGYRHGSIYINRGRPMVGFIRYFPEDGDRRLHFRPDLETPAELYEPESIDSFYIDGLGLFFPADVRCTRFHVTGFSEPADQSFIRREVYDKRVCLRVLVRGDSINLYECATEKRFFLNTPARPRLVELLYCAFPKNGSSGALESVPGRWDPWGYRFVGQFFGYRDSLRALVGPAHRLTWMVDNMPYTSDSLIAFARSLNAGRDMTGSEGAGRGDAAVSNGVRQLRFYLGIGLVAARLSLIPPGWGSFTPFSGPSALVPAGSFGVLYHPQDAGKRWELRGGASYLSYHDSYTRSAAGFDTVQYRLKTAQLSFSAGVLYRLFTLAGEGSISAGLFFNERIVFGRAPFVYWTDGAGNKLVQGHSPGADNGDGGVSLNLRTAVSRRWELMAHWTPSWLRFSYTDNFYRLDSFTFGLSLNFLLI